MLAKGKGRKLSDSLDKFFGRGRYRMSTASSVSSISEVSDSDAGLLLFLNYTADSYTQVCW